MKNTAEEQNGGEEGNADFNRQRSPKHPGMDRAEVVKNH